MGHIVQEILLVAMQRQLRSLHGDEV